MSARHITHSTGEERPATDEEVRHAMTVLELFKKLTSEVGGKVVLEEGSEEGDHVWILTHHLRKPPGRFRRGLNRLSEYQRS